MKNKNFQLTPFFFSCGIEEEDDSTNQAPILDSNHALLETVSNNSHPT